MAMSLADGNKEHKDKMLARLMAIVRGVRYGNAAMKEKGCSLRLPSPFILKLRST